MRVLLDTNILIHREASRVINDDIGILFNWLDKLNYEKCIHRLSLTELQKHSNPEVVSAMQIKVQNYNMLKTIAPEDNIIRAVREKFDENENDAIDTSLLNELYNKRVDFLITEDRKIHQKATFLGINSVIYSIDDFLEKVTAENPGLADYNVLSVKKERFGHINIKDGFFNSFRSDYDGFDEWFNRKSDEEAYICKSGDGEILAFLYVKIEGINEGYRDITPYFPEKLRLKIGTFKVSSNGYKLGERFLKIVFDNALRYKVDEVYVTLFNKTEEHERLIGLLIDWGFKEFGKKTTPTGKELVFTKDFHPIPCHDKPKLTYPFIDRDRRFFIVPIYPQYHTELFPDSILRTESPDNFVESEPHRNAVQKVYISRSYERDLKPGDIIIFYRTAQGGSAYYTSVVTTIGIVEEVYTNIQSGIEFIHLCRRRSVFDDAELLRHWNYQPKNRPFIVNFLYTYSLPKRPNLKRLIELGVIRDNQDAPRGFRQINSDNFESILEASEANESFIVN